MLELDSALAQDIVDRAMAILPHNVNVMDAQGMIIGSGAVERLHTRHEGAQLVLANRRVVEIDERTASSLRGVRPGVNLPLLHAGRLVGVIGITGDPERVRPYAELVRMTAEMLLEQRRLQGEQHWQRHRLEAWLRSLMEEGQGLDALLLEAERLGLQPSWPRQLCLVEIEGEDALVLQARLLDLLGQRSEHFVSPLGRSELLWLRPWQSERDDGNWLAQASQRGWGVVRLLVSDVLADLEALRQVGPLLRHFQAYARSRQTERPLLWLEQHRLEVLLFAQREGWLMRGWLAPLRRLQAQDNGDVLRQTLECWFRHDGQAQACAEALGIHRNTLRYRLERVQVLSGLDLARLADRAHLMLALGVLGGRGCAPEQA